MNAPDKGRVVIVEDDRPLREALVRLLLEARYQVEAFGSAEAYLVAAAPEDCHCLLLDVRLPGLSGQALQQRLNEEDAPRFIVFMTGHGTIPAAVEAIRKGAVDYLTKPVEEDALFKAVDTALDHCRMEKALNADRRAARTLLARLTPRENDVLGLVVSGLPNKAIADQLGIALPTVKIHRGRVMEKMQADSLVDLVNRAEQAGFQPDSENT